MSKFVSVTGKNKFAKIREYIKENDGAYSYYIAPGLMHEIMDIFALRTALVLDTNDIKIKDQVKYDLIVVHVFNKVFDEILFRIETIKTTDGSAVRCEHNIDYTEVVFGLANEILSYGTSIESKML